MNQQKQQPIIKTQNEYKSPNKERFLLIFLIVALVLSVFGYAMTVDKFTDYSPPSTLYIDWADYFKMLLDEPSPNNEKTERPRWSAEYPYRALLIGRTNDSAKRYQYIMIYSKQPTTSLFTFEYIADKSSRCGYIRAKINQTAYTNSTDIAISYINFSDAASAYYIAQPSTWGTYTALGHTTGNDVYFDFDFYYDCTNKHQQNTQLLNVSGLTSLASVPYAYILECDDPPPGGSSSGSSSGGGSSSSGTSGQKWGNGKYGGGIDWGGNAPSIKDGGGYSSSRSDWEYSSPDYWKNSYDGGTNSGKYSWEIDSNIPNYNFNVPVPPFTGQGQGDTGYSGGTLPDFSNIPKDNIDFNFTIPSMPKTDNIFTIDLSEYFNFINTWPPKLPK